MVGRAAWLSSRARRTWKEGGREGGREGEWWDGPRGFLLGQGGPKGEREGGREGGRAGGWVGFVK